jgi:hypothetical protein
MKYKTVAATLILFFAGCQGERKISRQDEKSPHKTPHTVIAYYFHGNIRCHGCLQIEAMSAEAIKSGFEKALQDGSLDWAVINKDQPGAESFVTDFQLDTSSLILTDTQNGERLRWKKLDEVWELYQDKDAFTKYVQEEVAAYLKGI